MAFVLDTTKRAECIQPFNTPLTLIGGGPSNPITALDGEVYGRDFAGGDIVHGDLAAVAIRGGR